ncbi:MAG: N-acetylglucosamine-6-phosphate deacetylase [Oscillospiraceae bacterium]
MILKNGFVLDKSFRFVKTDVVVTNGKISHIGVSNSDDNVVDCTGKYIIPGLVDIHTHGCGGCDACDATRAALEILSETQGKAGITSFCATTMTVPEEQLNAVFTTIGDYMKEKPKGAEIIGINMEGPFFNMSKKGAQRGDCLLLPSVEFFRKLNEKCGNKVKLIDLAPELEGTIEFIKAVKDEVAVSIGHTAADYDIAMDAILNGASHITHLYNAMNGLTHRAPGVIGAASDTNVYAELICDGIHIDPSAVRCAFKLMEDRICLISDSMSACGMPNGEYELGGQKVFMADKKATLVDGTIAGSATNLADCMRKAVEFGIPLETAIKAATFNPAASIGMQNKIGSIDINLDADIIVMDKELNFEKVYFKGTLGK